MPALRRIGPVLVTAALLAAGIGVGCQTEPDPVAGSGPAPPRPEEPSWRLGVFRGSLRPDYVKTHEEWLGRRVEVVVEMIPHDSWELIERPTKQLEVWAGTPYDVVFTTPMLPSEGASLGEGARGAYDERWRTFGTTMVEGGRPDALIRLGHEFNHTFYPWAAGNGRERDYAEYYRRIVTVLRSVPGADLRFIWNPLAGVETADVDAAYPGDEYVDVVSLDVYDSVEDVTDFEARWERTVSQPVGLAWLKAFATEHGKPMAFDEWGLVTSTDPEQRDPSGDSGDNTVFINRMLDFFEREDVLYASYFDWKTSYGSTDSRIMNGPYPNASATYRRRVGAAGGAAPSASPSTTAAAAPAVAPACPDGAIALVVGNAERLPAGDVPMRDRLERQGHDTCVVDDDRLGPETIAGVGLVIVSSSVVPTKVPGWLADHAGPLLATEAHAHAALRLGSGGAERTGTDAHIVDAAHPLAAGLGGTVTVQSAGEVGVATAVAGAHVVARAADGGDMVWALERDVAPARRVGFFFAYDSPPRLSADGWSLFDAAVGWLLD